MIDFLLTTAGQLILAAALGTLAFPFILARRRRARKGRVRLEQTGTKTTGQVLEVWRDQEGWNVTYEFTPVGRTLAVQKTETFEECDTQPSEVGASILVAYEPYSPYYSVPVLPHLATVKSAIPHAHPSDA